METRIRVAVTGAGGGVGQSILKALQSSAYDVVALDAHALATGLYAARKSYLIPRPDDPDFVDEVLTICQKESCRLLFPGLDTELPVLAQEARRFVEVGTIPIVSSPDVVELCDNKLATYQALSRHGIGVPVTMNLSGNATAGIPLPYPYVVKKREGGSRSRDVHVVRNAGDLTALKASGVDLSLFVAQEHIDGEEFTCGSVNLDGTCHGVIVMRRLLRDGDTYRCFVVSDDTVEAEVYKAMDAVKPFGACNVQLRMRDGRPFIFEINARCSGTTAARAMSGFNEPRMIADYLCRGIAPSYAVTEQTILRYWRERVVPNSAVEDLTRDRVLTRSSPEPL